MGNKLRHEGDEVRIKVIWPEIWFPKVNGPALLQERWRNVFFQPPKWLGTIEHHPNIHIIE